MTAPSPLWTDLAQSMLPVQLMKDTDGSEASPITFMTHVRMDAEIAHDTNDHDYLTRAYGYGQWAFDQPVVALKSASLLTFFWSMCRGTTPAAAVVPWLSSEVLNETRNVMIYAGENLAVAALTEAEKSSKLSYLDQVQATLAVHLAKVVVH
jgi:hypothetical protein